MSKKRRTFDLGRDSKTGQFIEVEEARKRPDRTTVERIPKRSRGDAKNEPSTKKD
jgi:hypothetical protein